MARFAYTGKRDRSCPKVAEGAQGSRVLVRERVTPNAALFQTRVAHTTLDERNDHVDSCFIVDVAGLGGEHSTAG